MAQKSMSVIASAVNFATGKTMSVREFAFLRDASVFTQTQPISLQQVRAYMLKHYNLEIPQNRDEWDMYEFLREAQKGDKYIFSSDNSYNYAFWGPTTCYLKENEWHWHNGNAVRLWAFAMHLGGDARAHYNTPQFFLLGADDYPFYEWRLMLEFIFFDPFEPQETKFRYIVALNANLDASYFEISRSDFCELEEGETYYFDKFAEKVTQIAAKYGIDIKRVDFAPWEGALFNGRKIIFYEDKIVATDRVTTK